MQRLQQGFNSFAQLTKTSFYLKARIIFCVNTFNLSSILNPFIISILSNIKMSKSVFWSKKIGVLSKLKLQHIYFFNFFSRCSACLRACQSTNVATRHPVRQMSELPVIKIFKLPAIKMQDLSTSIILNTR
jgi:hypothetical protein